MVPANVEHLFNLVQDTIHVVESKPAKRYGDYFLRQIVKVCKHIASWFIIFLFATLPLYILTWTICSVLFAAWRGDQWDGRYKAGL